MAMNGSYIVDDIYNGELYAKKYLEWSATKNPYTNTINLTINHYYEYCLDDVNDDYSVKSDGWGVLVNGLVVGEIEDDLITFIGKHTKSLIQSRTIELNCKADGTIDDIEIFCCKYNHLTSGVHVPTEGRSCNYDIGTTIKLDDIHNIKIKKGSAWKSCSPFVKVNGTWKRCIVWKKISGIWRKGV